MTLTHDQRVASFWRRTDKRGPGDCWNWKGQQNAYGYGSVDIGGVGKERRRTMAHRFSYRINVGPIPDGLVLDHLCRNRLCVNPAHLEPVTNHENILRGVAPSAAHARKTHCKNGHPFSGENLVLERQHSGKGFARKCRQCKRDAAKRYQQRKKVA